MNKQRIAFFKASKDDWFGKAIDLFSGRVGYSHCELVIDSKTMIGSHYLRGGTGVFYYNNIYNSKNWDIYEIDLDSEKILEEAHKRVGMEYDTLGVVLHFIGLNIGDKEAKEWCSEHTATCIREALVIPEVIDALPMPNEHYLELREKIGLRKVLAPKTTESDLGFKTDLRFKTNIKEIDRYGRVGYSNGR